MPDVHDEDVLIKVASCGVCHTDLKVVEGRNRFTPPTILGHEVAGTVEQVGAHCKDFKVGDRVIIGMRYKCGRCRYCLSARENLCERRPAPPTLKKARRHGGDALERRRLCRVCVRARLYDFQDSRRHVHGRSERGRLPRDDGLQRGEASRPIGAWRVGAGDRLRRHRPQHDSISQMLRRLSDHRRRHRRGQISRGEELRRDAYDQCQRGRSGEGGDQAHRRRRRQSLSKRSAIPRLPIRSFKRPGRAARRRSSAAWAAGRSRSAAATSSPEKSPLPACRAGRPTMSKKCFRWRSWGASSSRT